MLQNAAAAGATRATSAAAGKVAVVAVPQISKPAAANHLFWCCILQQLLELLLATGMNGITGLLELL